MSQGGWEKEKRKRAGHDGKGKKEGSLLPSFPALEKTPCDKGVGKVGYH